MGRAGYQIMELLQMDACTDCRLCVDVCPAVRAANDDMLSAKYRISELRRIIRSRSGPLSRFFSRTTNRDGLKRFGDTVFDCTLCGRCREVCPSGIQLTDLWVSVRRDMVHSRTYPEKVDRILDNLTESRNVFDEDNEERADWVEDLPDAPDHGYIKDQAEMVYFTGCVASYYPMAQKIPSALVAILDAAGVDFTLLGEAEWCCGFPLRGAGFRDRAAQVIDHNMSAVRAKGARDIVFSCPSCYQMWREHYPDAFNLYHVTQYVTRLIATHRLAFKAHPLTVTYHDPCDLGRGSGEYDAPRRIIRAIPGVDLIEMPHNREKCLCCGGGGNLEMIHPELSGRIAKAKMDEALQTGAEVIVTACQQCVRVMTTVAKRNKLPIAVMDITQLIHEARIDTDTSRD